MSFEYSDINSSVDFVKRSKELSQTERGRILLKNITKGYLSRLIDFTKVSNTKQKLSEFTKLFTDIVRPNKFGVMINFENNSGDIITSSINEFVKSITAPTINTNKMVFKRAGKTIKIPLNQDVPDNLDLSFYQDIDNTVINELVNNINNINDVGYHSKEIKISLSFVYKIALNKNPSMNVGVLNTALNFFNIDAFNGYKNTGHGEPAKKVGIEKPIENKIVEIRYDNIFIDSMSGFEGDQERVDTYSEIKIGLGFNGVKMLMWDLSKMNAGEPVTDATTDCTIWGI
jgi:hypothetical protein